MNNAYCEKHFIGYCPELSATCPYCEVEWLKKAIKDTIERMEDADDGCPDFWANELRKATQEKGE